MFPTHLFTGLLAMTSLLGRPVASLAARNPMHNLNRRQRLEPLPVPASKAVGPDSDFVVRPGPGLPSLDSLGITAADLVDETWLQTHAPNTFLQVVRDRNQSVTHTTSSPSGLQRRVICGPGVSGPQPTFLKMSARACQGYLESLGEKRCTVRSLWDRHYLSIMCEAGERGTERWAQVVGYHLLADQNAEVSSYCMHVAYGVQVVVDKCGVPGNSERGQSGTESAWGNGDLIVETRGW